MPKPILHQLDPEPYRALLDALGEGFLQGEIAVPLQDAAAFARTLHMGCVAAHPDYHKQPFHGLRSAPYHGLGDLVDFGYQASYEHALDSLTAPETNFHSLAWIEKALTEKPDTHRIANALLAANRHLTNLFHYHILAAFGQRGVPLPIQLIRKASDLKRCLGTRLDRWTREKLPCPLDRETRGVYGHDIARACLIAMGLGIKINVVLPPALCASDLDDRHCAVPLSDTVRGRRFSSLESALPFLRWNDPSLSAPQREPSSLASPSTSMPSPTSTPTLSDEVPASPSTSTGQVQPSTASTRTSLTTTDDSSLMPTETSGPSPSFSSARPTPEPGETVTLDGEEHTFVAALTDSLHLVTHDDTGGRFIPICHE